MRTGVQGAGCDEDTDEGKCGWGVWTEVNSVSQKQAVLKKNQGNPLQGPAQPSPRYTFIPLIYVASTFGLFLVNCPGGTAFRS